MRKILICNFLLLCFFNLKLFSVEIGMPMEKPVLPPPMPAEQEATAPIGLPVSQEELEVDMQKQRLEQLKIEVDNIEQQEETLMGDLRELQNQIDQARVQASNARQTNKQILNAQTVEQAKGLLNQLNMILNQVQAIKTSLQGQFSANFNNTVSQIQNKVQLVQAKINEIKNITAKIFSSQPEPAVVVEKKIELQSPIAKKAAETGAYIVSGFNWLKRLLSTDLTQVAESPPGERPTEVVEQISQVEVAQTVPQAIPVPVFSVETQPQAVPQTIPLTGDSLNEKFSKQMELYNKKIQQLKEQKEKIKEEEVELEKRQRLLNELKQQKVALKKYQELMTQLGFAVEQAKEEGGKFRQNMEFVFGKVLDFSGYFLDKFGNVSKGIYNKLLLPRLEKFVKAVQQKVEDKKQKKESEEVIEKTTIFMPTTPAVTSTGIGQEMASPPPPVMMDTTMQYTGIEPMPVVPPPPLPMPAPLAPEPVSPQSGYSTVPPPPMPMS